MTTKTSLKSTSNSGNSTKISADSLLNASEPTNELTINDWRLMLSQFAKGLESGDISPVAANAFANLMGKGLSSYKLQMEYAKALGKTPTIVALMPEPERGRDVKPRSDS